jgi:hypothetical protein
MAWKPFEDTRKVVLSLVPKVVLLGSQRLQKGAFRRRKRPITKITSTASRG